MRIFVDRQVIIESRGECLELNKSQADTLLDVVKDQLVQMAFDILTGKMPKVDYEEDVNEEYYNEPITIINTNNTYKRTIEANGWKCVVIFKSQSNNYYSRILNNYTSEEYPSLPSECVLYVQSGYHNHHHID